MRPYLELLGARLGSSHHAAERIAVQILRALEPLEIEVDATSDLQSILDYNEAHGSDPRVLLLPVIDPRFQPDASQEDTLCVYLRRRRRLIASCCARRLEIRGTMAARLEDQSLLFADPAKMAPSDQLVVCTASPAHNLIRDCAVAFLAGGHVEPVFRHRHGGFAYDALQRLTRLFIIATWRVAFMTSFNATGTTAKVGLRRYGHEGAHPYVRIYRGSTLVGDYNLMVSSIDYMRRLYVRDGAADPTVPILDLSPSQLAALRQRRAANADSG